MCVTVQYHREFHLPGETLAIKQELVSLEEYIDFLKRTDLGSQYPAEDFAHRIADLVRNVQISLIARDRASRVVGACFGLTDFSYWLLITDLGVDRSYVRSGLGRELMRVAHDLSGGERKIILLTYANELAVPFYEKIGMSHAESVMVKDAVDWTSFTVE